MIAAASAADVVTVLVACFMFLTSVITGLIAYIVRDIRKTIDRNAHHMDSLISTSWVLNWRMTTAEDFLEERFAYHPPRIVNRPADGG